MQAPKLTKTGTTIAGVIFKDGVILGADTRATAGTIVADKNCDKIHHISSNIQCCGAGTAADTECNKTHSIQNGTSPASYPKTSSCVHRCYTVKTNVIQVSRPSRGSFGSWWC